MSTRGGTTELISGTISDVKLGDKYDGNYSLRMRGRFERTGEAVDERLRSRYQPKVYERGKEGEIPADGIEGMMFKGRVLVKCYEQADGRKLFLNAVEVSELIGADRVARNPFFAYPETDDER